MATIDTSGIDITKPESGEATTQSVRDNFSALKTEIAKLENGNLIQFGQMIVGEPGTEDSGIDINGTTYDAQLKVSDIDNAHLAEVLIHRHSTTYQPLLIFARSNTDNSTHAAVTTGQVVSSIFAAGYTGSHYDLFGESRFSVGTGTVSATSAPGKWQLLVTADGAQTPTAAITVDSDKSATFAGAVDIDSGTIDGTTQASGTINGPIAAGGTWTAAATWTLPAYTLGGTVSLNGQSFSGTCVDGGSFTTIDINGGSIDGATIGASSASTGNFTTITAATPALPDGHISGLIGSQDADTDHDISIGAGAARDSTGAYDLRLSSSIVKQIDAAWTVGTNQGGLDTGSVAAGTEYWYFLIRKDSDASIDVLISASRTSPTMPAGYTYRSGPIHWVLTDGSANIIAHSAIEVAGGGIEYIWASTIEDADTSIGTTATAINISVPSYPVIAHCSLQSSNANAGAVKLYSPYIADTAIVATYNSNASDVISSDCTRQRIREMTNSSGQLRIVASQASQNYALYTFGFQWGRR